MAGISRSAVTAEQTNRSDARDFLTGLGDRRFEGRLGPLHKIWMESAKLGAGAVSWIRGDSKPFFRVGKNLRFPEIELGWVAQAGEGKRSSVIRRDFEFAAELLVYALCRPVGNANRVLV